MICIGFPYYFPLFFFFESNLLLLDYHMYYMTSTTEFFQINNIYIYIRLWLWWNVDVWSDVNVYFYGDIATISYLLNNLVCFGDKNTNFNFNSVSLRKREKKSNVLLIKLNYTNKPTTKALMFTIKKSIHNRRQKNPTEQNRKWKTNTHTKKHDYKKRHENTNKKYRILKIVPMLFLSVRYSAILRYFPLIFSGISNLPSLVRHLWISISSHSKNQPTQSWCLTFS